MKCHFLLVFFNFQKSSIIFLFEAFLNLSSVSVNRARFLSEFRTEILANVRFLIEPWISSGLQLQKLIAVIKNWIHASNLIHSSTSGKISLYLWFYKWNHNYGYVQFDDAIFNFRWRITDIFWHLELCLLNWDWASVIAESFYEFTMAQFAKKSKIFSILKYW